MFRLIKGIIFDIGGVVVDCRFKSFLERFEKISGMSKEELYSKIVDNRYWEMFEKGLLSEEDFKQKLENDMKMSHDLVELISSEWRKILKPIPETIKIIKRLKKRYKIFALSNVDFKTVEYCRKRFHVYDIFDGVVLSCEVHMRKPEKDIFLYTLESMKLKPEEVVFIDNYPKNIEGAKKLGIKTILFTTPQNLIKELMKLGVRV